MSKSEMWRGIKFGGLVVCLSTAGQIKTAKCNISDYMVAIFTQVTLLPICSIDNLISYYCKLAWGEAS